VPYNLIFLEFKDLIAGLRAGTGAFAVFDNQINSLSALKATKNLNLGIAITATGLRKLVGQVVQEL